MLDLHRPLERGLLKEGSDKDQQAVRQLILHLMQIAGIDEERRNGHRIRAVVGVPAEALRVALKRASLEASDLDLVEINEAFAAQALAVIRELGLNEDILNVNGGAIALGHPIGASGARVLTTLLYAMKAHNARKGLATLCIGGGMGIAMCVEAA